MKNNTAKLLILGQTIVIGLSLVVLILYHHDINRKISVNKSILGDIKSSSDEIKDLLNNYGNNKCEDEVFITKNELKYTFNLNVIDETNSNCIDILSSGKIRGIEFLGTIEYKLK